MMQPALRHRKAIPAIIPIFFQSGGEPGWAASATPQVKGSVSSWVPIGLSNLISRKYAFVPTEDILGVSTGSLCVIPKILLLVKRRQCQYNDGGSGLKGSYGLALRSCKQKGHNWATICMLLSIKSFCRMSTTIPTFPPHSAGFHFSLHVNYRLDS